MRHAIPSSFLLASMLVFGGHRSLLPQAARPVEGISTCKLESLPEEVREHLKREFSAWKVQESGDLSPHAHERWDSEKPQQCPGIAVGQFEKDKSISYGVLLVPQGRPDASYKFLVFSPKEGGLPSYQTHVLDQSDESGARNLFIRSVEIGKFFGEPSIRKFRVQAHEGILFVDSGENEYESDIYFWTGDNYRHQPVDY